MHDSVYFAGLEAATTGLVTTRTASPLAGSPCGVTANGFTVIVPGAVNWRVAGGEFWPSDSAQ